MAAVAGIDHDASDLEAESANQAAVAIRGRRSFARRGNSAPAWVCSFFPRHDLFAEHTATAVGPRSAPRSPLMSLARPFSGAGEQLIALVRLRLWLRGACRSDVDADLAAEPWRI